MEYTASSKAVMVADDGLRPGWAIMQRDGKIYEQPPYSTTWYYVCTWDQWQRRGYLRDQEYLFEGAY